MEAIKKTTPLQAFLNRHEAAKVKLKQVAQKKLRGKVASAICAQIGFGLGVSGQCIHNYVKGACSDGFLTEAITVEFEKL